MPKESAPNGSKVSESDQKKRSARWSLPPRNSRSQLAVNWSSRNFPGLVRMSEPVFKLELHVLVAGSKVWVTPGVPATVGNRKPPGLAPNWFPGTFNNARATGSIDVRGTAGQPGTAGLLNTDSRLAAER